MGELAPDSGSVDVGATVRWGYYSQQGMELDESKKVIDVVSGIADDVRLAGGGSVSASQFLSRFLFDPREQQKPVGKLSGGEKRRLYLAITLMRNPNFLILDEPTNDLDIVTLSVLEEYLMNFKGCLIVVSHDRFFLDRVTEHLFVIEPEGKITDFPGDYSTYRHCLIQRQKELKEQEEKKARPASPSEETRRGERKRRLTFKERKEMEELEGRLPELEKEKETLGTRMSSGEMTSDEIVRAGARMREIVSDIDAAETRLLELMEIDD